MKTPRLTNLARQFRATTRGLGLMATVALLLWPASGFAQNGSALSFAGGDDYVLAGRPAIPVPWTAEFWINRTDATNSYAELWGDNAGALRLEQWSGTRRVGFTQYGVADWAFNYTAPANTWVHLAFVAEAGVTRLYVNGVPQDTNAHSISLPLRGFGAALKGMVDEARVWSVARSPSEIQTNRSRTLTGREPGLVAYYRFDEGPGFTARDATTNGYDLALFDSRAWASLGAAVPSALTQPADFTTPTTATLNAEVSPNGLNATAWFEWGSTTAYGNQTATTILPTATASRRIQAALSGLAPGTTYHCRVVASNSLGVVYGNDQSLAVFDVTNPGDSGAGSLRQRLADATPGATILLTNAGTILLTSGELAVTKSLRIAGPGAATLSLSGNSASRVFNIASGIAVTVSGVTIMNGHSANGGLSAPGQSGGGILNAGFLTLNDCVVANNSAGAGGASPTAGIDLAGAPGGAGGNGGGLYNTASGMLTLNRCTITSNQTGVGGRGGDGGHGYNDSGFFGGAGHNGGNGGAGGTGGVGAGLYSEGIAIANQSLFTANVGAAGAAGGNGGGGGSSGSFYYGRSGGAGGLGGRGGEGNAIYATREVRLFNCTLNGNQSGGGGLGGNGGGPGSGGMGSGSWGAPANGGNGGNGGGLCSSHSAMLRSCTVAANVTGPGGSGGTLPYGVAPGAAGRGGGIALASGTARLVNTAVGLNVGSGSGADNVFGNFASSGHNLIETTAGSSGFGAGGDLLNQASLLGLLADNGGPTLSRAPLPGSPLVNAGDDAAAASTDQRNFPRIQGAAVDIGALEVQGAPLVTTLPASAVVSVGPSATATLNGTVGASGLATVAWFEWGTNLSYGNFTAATNLGSDSALRSVTHLLPALPAGVVYHYRLAASNSFGVMFGADERFAPLLITLTGSDLMNLPVGQPYAEPGYLVTNPLSEQATGIAAGAFHSTAIRANGTVAAWGANSSGQSTVPAGLSNVTAVAAHGLHNLALRNDGSLAAWGDNSYGQLSVPPAATNIAAIALGGYHDLAVRSNGTVVAWGQGSSGQTTVPAHATNVAQVAAGFAYSLALRRDGSVVGWGANDSGQINIPPAATNVVAIAAGEYHNLALKPDGSVIAWGQNAAGQTAVPATLSNVIAIAAGSSHSLALQSNGVLIGWGDNSSGQLTPPPALSRAVRLASSYEHTLAIDANGRVHAWGNNADGQINVPSELQGTAPQWITGTIDFSTPGTYTLTYHATNSLGAVASVTRTVVVFAAPVVTTLPVTDVLATELRTVARLNGTVNPNGAPTLAWFEWGAGTTYGNKILLAAVGSGSEARAFNSFLTNLAAGVTYHCRLVASNQAGITFGASERFATLHLTLNGPPAITNLCHADFLDPWVTVRATPLALAAGFSHSLALKADGTVAGWGDNTFGQAAAAPSATNAVAIAAGAFHSLALRSDGSVVGWGLHTCGQTNIPASATNVVAIGAGHSHSLAVRSDGSVLAWGAGTNATGTNLNFGQALVPASCTNAVAVAGGGSHSLALLADGHAVAWGDNSAGQTNVPSAATNLLAIAAGLNHNLALRKDGRVFAWGDSSVGQATVPVAATNVVAIAAGARHSVALKADGAVLAWGDPNSGQVNIPASFSNVVMIAAGGSHNLALLADGRVAGWGSDESGQLQIPAGLDLLQFPIAVSRVIPVDVPGLYELSYTVTNRAGATAQVSRTVFIPFTGPIAGHVYDVGTGLPGITISALREWQEYPGRNLELPDVGTLEFPITVVGTNAVGAIEAGVGLLHPFRGDLRLTLIHSYERPPGVLNRTEVRLKDSSIDEDFADLNHIYSSLTESETVGRLTDFYGQPMYGDWILRVTDSYPGDRGLLQEWRLHLGVTNVTTTAGGSFRFSELDTVPYYVVQPLWAGYGFAPPAANYVTVGTTNLQFNLLNAPISGRVLSGGAGLAGVKVSAANAQREISVLTDAAGNYLLPALAPGAYVVTPYLEGHTFLPPASNVAARATGVDFTVVTYPILGRITNSFGYGVAGILVSNGPVKALTDLDGYFVLTGVTPGNWTVRPGADRTEFTPASRAVKIGPAQRNVDFGIVSSPPTISPMADRVIPANTNTGAIRFTVGDGEIPSGYLKVTVTSSNPDLVPITATNVVFEGAGAERVLIITPATNAVGTTRITLTVSDSPPFEGGPILSTSTSFNLRVNARPVAGVGLALALDGTNDYVRISTNVLPFKGSFTVEAWVNTPSNAFNGAAHTLFSQGVGSNAFALGFDAQGRVRFGTNWTPLVPFPRGGWHHLAMTRDNTNTLLYVDGVPRASRGTPLPHPPQPGEFCIGARPGGAGEFWAGEVDEVRIWHRALTTAEIQQNTNRIVLGPETGLAGLWRFDPAARRPRTNALDSSLAGQPGALFGNPTWVQAGVTFEYYLTPEENAFTDVLPAFDADGDPLSYRIINAGEKGEAQLVMPDPASSEIVTNSTTGAMVTNSLTGAMRYAPKPNISGLDRFSFLVTDGFEESDLAVMTVNIMPDTNAPFVSAIADQITAEETPITIPFQIRDLETPANDLVVTAQSSDLTVIPTANLEFSGAGTNRLLTVTPATNQCATNLTITILVNDGQYVTSSAFRLTITNVNDAPVLSDLPANVFIPRATTGPVSFTVGDVDHPVPSLKVAAWTTDPTIAVVVATNGTGPARSVTLQSFATSAATTLVLALSDGAITITNEIKVTVNNPPVLDLAAGGAFKGFANQPSSPIAFTVGDTETPFPTLMDTNFNPLVDGEVYALAVQPNGQILVGGWFSTVGGQAHPYLARLNPDGSLDTNFTATANSGVRCLLVLPSGQILVGGTFTAIAGQAGNYLARLNPDGSLDTNFIAGVNGTVYCLALQTNGQVLVGGAFTTLGGQSHERLGRLNSDGSVDPNFNVTANSTVVALALQPDGKILPGGSFSVINGQPRLRLARLLSDGSLDGGFANPNLTGSLWALVVQPSGQIVIGGSFSRVAGQVRSRLARLQPDGTLDSSFNPGANSTVYALAAQTNGQILAGGWFSTLGGQRRLGLGRLNADGTLDTGFNPGCDGDVLSLTAQPNGQILVGGYYYTLGGYARRCVGRLNPNFSTGLQITATASDPTLVSQFSFSGDGANRTVIITPASNRVGTVTITLTAIDGDGNQSSTTFTYTILPLPPYTVIDLGALAGSYSYAYGINDNGQVVGYSAAANGNPHAFLWDTNVMRDLGTLTGGSYSYAYGINARGQVVGEATVTGGYTHAFLWDTNVLRDLNATLGGSYHYARDINERGQIAGRAAVAGNTEHAYLWETNHITDLATLGGNYSQATAINALGQVTGYSTDTNGYAHAFLWQTNTMRDLGTLGYQSFGLGLNEAGQVVGYTHNSDWYYHAFLWQTNRMLDLGTLGGYESGATAINNDGQIVGWSTTLSDTRVAAAFFDGIALDLNTYLPADSGWSTLREATAINHLGGIVGYGYLKNGSTHAFLLQPKWIIGEPVPIPYGAINPESGKPYRTPDYTPQDAFVWGEAEGKLYPIRPVTTTMVKWYDTAATMDATGTNLVLPKFTATAACVWPEFPQIHVAGAPVPIEPPQTGVGCRFLLLEYTTSDATVDFAAKTFNSTATGYSVLRYLRDVPVGATPDPEQYTNLLQVVRTVAWNNPNYLVANQPAVVGEKLTEPPGRVPSSSRSGFVLHTNAYYDSVAYDRATQTGPILPVNANDQLGTQDDLVVAFYHTNTITGVEWPDLPVHYAVRWPTNADQIVIASGLGSGLLDPLEYREMQIYNQPDATRPGFNPNEEHALFAPSGAGQALFALRNDLNAAWGSSSNFVLLKYRPADTNEWHLKLFEVVAENPTYRFQYGAEAGTEIQPPYPLGMLPLCPERNTVVSGRAHRDYAGRIYVRAADTADTPDPRIVVRYFYPLMPSFYYKTNAGLAVTNGDCLAWLDQRAPGTLAAPNDAAGRLDTPIDVTYTVTWPTNVPTLQLGETLLTAKGGLPNLKNMASAELVFDSLNPDGLVPTNAAVRMFDPLSARALRLTNVAGISASYQFPASVRHENVGGVEVFTDLPYVLRSRLSYDPMNQTLSFKGVLDESGVGEPLLLLNVLSARERDRIKALSAEPRFQSIVDALYKLTRNPNQVDALGTAIRKSDLVPTDGLLIGFINKFTFTVQTNANVQVNYLKAGTPEITVAELRRLEATNAVNQPGRSVTVFVRAARLEAPTNFTRVEVALESFGDGPKALTAGLPLPAGGVRYLTIVENDNASLSGLPVGLKLIALTNRLFRGDVKIIYPDNVFDEKLTLRHSLDFAGAPENAEFEWYYHPDLSSFLPTDLPLSDANGQITDARGWQLFNVAAQRGVNDITLGDGGQSSLFTLQDNWFVLRYRYTSGGETNWSPWVGDPASGATPRAILAEGWIKRVIKGINQFEARVKDFHSAATATYASMLIQAGQRYEGDIALNPNPDNLNSIGLIETYETILRRGKGLSIDGVPPVSSDPANNALLLAASRISDLYMLLGNEAFADAADPLVMFTTDSGVYGSLAPSIFCFQNQLDSLLEEELALLRGRDDRAAGVGAKPIYNRLFWNFTTGEGEVAYAQTYNITDQNLDGVIDEYDARILFPQGHGDAWGHYLTATTTYYDLLRHPRYVWVPRAESIVVAGASVSVDFLDERKFANAAAAKARTGAQLVDLSYRARYVDDPAGQWQGYKDTDSDRAWGMTEWARRAGQAAYFDWLTANAILPTTDPNTNHTGIQQIDRTTVAELSDIAAQYAGIQSQMDQADAGLNPLGLAKNVVPFDIDPIKVDQAGLTHFEQISQRAVKMMNNAVLAWNEVNQLSEALRRNQDSVQEFTANVNDQERDYKNRLIELYGYPYAGDIGAGQTYPSGYDGPDLYHYMYAHTTDLMATVPSPNQTLKGYFTPFKTGLESFGFYFENDLADLTSVPKSSKDVMTVDYPMTATDYALVAPPSWGQRRAPGEIQLALSELLQTIGRYQLGLVEYDNALQDIEDQTALLQARYNLREDTIQIRDTLRNITLPLKAVSAVSKGLQSFFASKATTAYRLGEIASEGFPKVVGLATDCTSVGRVGVRMAALAGSETMGKISAVAGVVGEGATAAAEAASTSANTRVETKNYGYEQTQALLVLEKLIRKEKEARVEMARLGEAVNQQIGTLQAATAKGERLIQERVAFRKKAAAQTQTSRYKDMAFRVFRNDAIQKYRAQFDLAARYVYLAASAYDYEVNRLGSDNGSGRKFFTDIVRQRSLGQMRGGVPVVGVRGLADPLARLNANFEVLKGQMGFLTPEIETGRFSLRSEMFRVRPQTTNAVGVVTNPESQKTWRDALKNCQVANLWDVPEFRRYCRAFAPESAGPQPGLVIRFPTTVTFGLNFFGWPLSGGDSAYDSSRFATKIRSVGVWFNDYDGIGLSATPRVYLVPVGADVLRTPTANDFTTREWKVVDQAIPEPYPLGPTQFQDPAWIPLNDTLSDSLIAIRRCASFRAYHDAGWNAAQMATDSRLIGRSVWNTEWMLIIPGGTFLNNPDDGLERFIGSVSDIKLFFQTYSYPGN